MGLIFLWVSRKGFVCVEGGHCVTRPVPTDFAHFARIENDRQLEDRYGLSIKVIRRMRAATGITSPAYRPIKQLPCNFADYRLETNTSLAHRFDVGEKVIRRWRKEYAATLKEYHGSE